jgi:hypothetical protein
VLVGGINVGGTATPDGKMKISTEKKLFSLNFKLLCPNEIQQITDFLKFHDFC